MISPETRAEIRRYVDDDQPGWVECAFTDAHGREWLFIEKVPVVTVEFLNTASGYPRAGVIACEVIAENDRVVVTMVGGRVEFDPQHRCSGL